MGAFIAIEGIEGAGKSTLRSSLAKRFSELGNEVVLTREPGATSLGQAIRTILLNPNNENLNSIAELMLFAADRAQHVAEIVKPALERNAIVICDRYIYSTIAYQGYGRGLDLEKLKSINDFATGGLLPDKVLLLDLDPEVGLRRALERTRKATLTFNAKEFGNMLGNDNADESWSRFERQALEFHSKVRNGFLELSKQNPEIFHKLDATLDEEALAKEAAGVVSKFF